MADLFVTPHTPTLGVGRALRVYAIVKALAVNGPVDVLYARFGADEPSPEYVDQPNIRLHVVEPSRGARRAAAAARAVLAGTPPKIARTVSSEIGARARELAPAPGTGRIVADATGTFMALRGLILSHGVVYNAHNLESSFQDSLGADRLGSERQLARFERRILGRAAESWMVSHADVAGALALCPGARVRYVPNVVDVAGVTPPAPPPRTGVAMLVADFTWPPNRQAVRFLLDEVMERVWRELPEARLRLVGRGLELDGRVDPRVDAVGFVDDLEAAYADAACVLVPLLAGGGSPLKFVEGLAHGLPVVATPLAAQGLDVVPGEHFRQGEGAEAYARELVAVLRDGAPEVAAAGRRVAQERYSIGTLARLLTPGAPLA
ncbi:MAG: hypothetical protein JWO90_1425 [Solirubrobacterales bacterium]|nr:hypothetical protein [Solirubrobacterales bacterium]